MRATTDDRRRLRPLVNLAILLVGTALAVVAARPRATPGMARAATAALFALMAVAPLLSSTTSVLFDALTALCVAYGWNVIGGFTGYASFGNVAYLGLGAFVAAGLMSRQPGHAGWPWFLGIPLAVAIVALVAGLVGLVVLRLRGHYFSIATLGVSVAMPEIISWDALFGPHGLVPDFFGGGRPLNFPLAEDVQLGGLRLDGDRVFLYELSLVAVAIAWALTLAVRRGKFGYGLVAIRENEEAAEVLGVDTTRTKIVAYMLSAGLAALGGSVLGYRLTNMTTEAEALFSTTNNLQMIIICLIGGAGTLWGPWVGAFILFAIQEALRMLSRNADFLAWQGVVFALLIVLVVLFLPRGVLDLAQARERSGWRSLARGFRHTRV